MVLVVVVVVAALLRGGERQGLARHSAAVCQLSSCPADRPAGRPAVRVCRLRLQGRRICLDGFLGSFMPLGGLEGLRWGLTGIACVDSSFHDSRSSST